MIGEALYSHLKADAALKLLVKRIYPDFIPEGHAAPAIVYSLDDDEHQPQLSGTAGAYKMALISLDCYDLNKSKAQRIANAVELALLGYRGILGTTTPAIDADHIRRERRFDLYESDTKYYRTALQITIGYEG